MRSTPGACTIKLFTDFCNKLECQSLASLSSHKHQTRQERFARDKHSSLLRKSVNYGRKKFYEIDPWLINFKWRHDYQSNDTRQNSKEGSTRLNIICYDQCHNLDSSFSVLMLSIVVLTVILVTIIMLSVVRGVVLSLKFSLD